MFRRLLYKSSLLAALFSLAIGTLVTYQSAHATSGLATIPWPNGIPVPFANLTVHGDGSLSVINNMENNCLNNYSSTAPIIDTYSPDGSAIYITQNDSGGWKVAPCTQRQAVGSDKAIYFVQVSDAYPYPERIMSRSGGAFLWASSVSFNFPNCVSHTVALMNLTLGFDGNLYAEAQACTGSNSVLALVGFDAATGKERFITQLPSNALLAGDVVLPYNEGLAVVNNGAHIYFYDYNGNMNTNGTFDPDSPAGTIEDQAAVAADGTAYLATSLTQNGSSAYHLYAKAIGSPVREITLPTATSFRSIGLYPTPSGGLAVLLRKLDGTTVQYIDYLEADGNGVYEKNLSIDANGATVVGSPSVGVDNLGNVIVVRTMQTNVGPGDQEVYVDSFDPSGIQTRLFDSEAQFGTSARDVFTTNWLAPTMTSESMGNGKIYLALCHQTYGYARTCSSDGNPMIVVVPAPGSFGYPRSAIFAAAALRQNYVALGDSFSSGEGNPPFIAPSDTDGCHRSAVAYPGLLAAQMGYNFRAFVACSGAATADIEAGMNTEPSQLNSIDASTDIVTLTAGGDDVGFKAFATACVNPYTSCDTTSSAYVTVMGNISSYLQAHLETLYTAIHTAAPNASIYVLGYPHIAAISDDGIAYCPYLTDGEITAATNVTDAVNTAILAAIADVQTTGGAFHFVDTAPAFDGHTVCASDSYFNNVSWPENYSFHPNQEGYVADAWLLANAIQGQ